MPISNPYVYSIWGPEKTGKTSFILSFPAVVSIHDFDLGFSRAVYRMIPEGGDINEAEDRIEVRDKDGNLLFRCYRYPAPLAIPSIKSQPLRGYRELWTRFLTNLMKDLEDKEVTAIAVDTATQAWQVCHMGFLQERQEAQMPLIQNPKGEWVDSQNRKLRESLIPIEYAEPNSRMQAVEQAAKGYGKNLILAHHQGAIYARRFKGETMEEYDTGEKQLDGFRRTLALSDIVLRTSINKAGVPSAEVTLCGLSLNLVGMVFEAPTHEKVLEAIRMIRGE